jgi:alkaline phosphatase D
MNRTRRARPETGSGQEETMIARSTIYMVLRSTVVLSVAGAVVNAGAAAFESAWPAGLTRTWVGPEYYADRLQDWRIQDGRLECVEASGGRPMRAVHLLVAALDDKPGHLTMSVRTGPIEPGPRTAESWSGFLIGAGGKEIDYRLTALVHHRPARDGGLVAAVDGTGRVVFRDNERHMPGGNIWSMATKLQPGELDEIPATAREGAGFGEEPLEEVELRLAAKPTDSDYMLILSAHDPADGSVISRATLEHVAPQLVDGGVALVSHLGPTDSRLGHWFRDWRVVGTKLVAHPERTFGPILCSQYTLSRGTLKLTAQMPPLGDSDTQTAQLQVRSSDDEEWRTVAESRLVQPGYTIPFRVENWDADRDMPFRIVYELRIGPEKTRTHYWSGTIRREPSDKPRFVVAAFTGNKHFTGALQWNHNAIWFPHNELVAAVKHHDPDLLFFSGDQVYEGDLTGAQREPPEKAMLDYLDKWYRWCWAFRELTRDRPCITIPDDHDVYHGNLWGAGGRHAKHIDDGGYIMPPEFVNMVERTQTSHLPDPYDPTPVAQGIGVYYTRVDYGGVSFVVLEDRKFKSSATVTVPEGKVINGWFHNPDFDPATQADMPGAVLLGERQLRFLRDWATDWSGGVWMKVALSQTLFANVATLPKAAEDDGVVPGLERLAPDDYPPDDKLAADTDSDGWPQTGRNKALREFRRGFALHIAGDQHLGSFVHYGVEDWDDAGFALCVPSIANTWPRRWYPPHPGQNHQEGMPRYTGQYRDGFGNHINVYAVSNPVISGREPARLYDRAPGYGIVRFDRQSRDIIVECWPRWVDPSRPDARQYPGWPVTVHQLDNYGRQATAYLPEIQVSGLTDPVIRVIDEADGEIVYALRIAGNVFRPKVFRPGTYAIEAGEPGTPRWKTMRSIDASTQPQPTLTVEF